MKIFEGFSFPYMVKNINMDSTEKSPCGVLKAQENKNADISFYLKTDCYAHCNNCRTGRSSARGITGKKEAILMIC